MSQQPWNWETLNQNLQQTWNALQSLTQSGGIGLQQQIEAVAERLAPVVVPLADLPLLKPLAKTPGLSWIAAALGQVNLAAIAQDIETLKGKNTQATSDELALKAIQDATLKAAGIGLATNFLPPIAITFFAVDMAAIATLQVELIYKIAALYGYDIQAQNRRGEVLALYVCCAGGSTLLKSGLSFPEIIPVIGAVIGASSDAAILWSIGQATQQYYKTKRHREDQQLVELEIE